MKILLLILLFSSHAWSFDHEHKIFADVLTENVLRKGAQTLVNYKAIKKDPHRLNEFILSLSKVTKDEFRQWTMEQKLATLINGYNAWTIQLISENYFVSSIKKIGHFYSTPWKIEFINWLGEKVSLDYIEHNVIRKDFKVPRVHFALVCAAMGCPTLQEEPYKASKLEVQLQKASNEFINDLSKNRFEIKDDNVQLHVSSIFKWYGADFGSESDVVNYIVKEMKIQDRVRGKRIELDYLDYDWNLNEIK